MNSKFIALVISFSFVISGCSFENGEPIASVMEPNPQISPTDTFESDDFKLTEVMDSRQLKPSEVLSFSCETITARPTEVTTSCADFGTSISNIEWKTWTATGAAGKGIYLVNNCDPNCASGKVFQSPVTVNLDGLYTDGSNYFLRYLTFKKNNKVSISEKIEETWDLAEFYLETPDMRSGN